jgi:hypothetical protein
MDFARAAREGHSVSRTAKQISITQEDLVILCVNGQIAEQDGDMLRALLELIMRERADINASARLEGRKDIEHA